MERVERKYNIIYADPPWQFRVWSNKGMDRSAEKHFPTQPADYLKSLNVPALCKKNAVVFLWATFPCLKEAFELAEAWGFTYKTVAFTWIKKNRSNNRLFIGMGYYTRANAEIVLLFTRGKPLKRACKNVQQIVVTKRGRHSEKPPEIRNRIVRLFGDLPRLELFARDNGGLFSNNEFEGWDVFGNEVQNSINLPG